MAEETGIPAEQESATTETVEPAAPKDPYEGLPAEFAWLKNDLEATRREAAGRRVELRELQDKFKDAKSPEEVQAAVAEAAKRGEELERELTRERVARKHKLDDDLVEFLTGKTDEEIEAQAAKLSALKPAGESPVVTKLQPTGGVSPSAGTPPEINGRDAWKQFRDRR